MHILDENDDRKKDTKRNASWSFFYLMICACACELVIMLVYNSFYNIVVKIYCCWCWLFNKLGYYYCCCHEGNNIYIYIYILY